VIEVTDPSHPLFGRRFTLVSGRRPSTGGSDHVLVVLHGQILLRLPVAATSLAPRPLDEVASKLTIEAVRELITLAESSGVNAWSSEPNASGNGSLRRCDATSPTSLPGSSRR
jgi:hypothetical protein